MNEEAAKAQRRADALAASIRSLAENPHFKLFLSEVVNLRDMAMREACMGENVGNPGKQSAALGEVRAYIDILDVVAAQVGSASVD